MPLAFVNTKYEIFNNHLVQRLLKWTTFHFNHFSLCSQHWSSIMTKQPKEALCNILQVFRSPCSNLIFSSLFDLWPQYSDLQNIKTLDTFSCGDVSHCLTSTSNSIEHHWSCYTWYFWNCSSSPFVKKKKRKKRELTNSRI